MKKRNYEIDNITITVLYESSVVIDNWDLMTKAFFYDYWNLPTQYVEVFVSAEDDRILEGYPCDENGIPEKHYPSFSCSILRCNKCGAIIHPQYAEFADYWVENGKHVHYCECCYEQCECCGKAEIISENIDFYNVVDEEGNQMFDALGHQTITWCKDCVESNPYGRTLFMRKNGTITVF
jgi:hypothetical protein